MAFNPETNNSTADVTNVLTNSSTSFQQAFMSVSNTSHDPAQEGQIIQYQPQCDQFPTITYAQLPSSHYLLLRSQINPNEFQIVSVFPPSTTPVCPYLSAPYPYISNPAMYTLPTSNQYQPQIPNIQYSLPYFSNVLRNSIPDVQLNPSIVAHPRQAGA